MADRAARLRAAAALALLASVLASCAALPRSGPLASQIDIAEPADDLEGLVVALTSEIAARVERPGGPQMPAAFRDAAPIDPERLGPGDIVEILVWETAEAPLLGPAAQGGGRLAGAPISASGEIFVPFVGSLRAAGATGAELRARIAGRLGALTLDPQVDVRLVEPRSRTVTVQGAVGRPGVYAIDRGALTLAPMLALAGGTTLPPEQSVVAVRRGAAFGATAVIDLFADPSLDVALRPGDQIVATPLRSRFIALGATGAQAEIPFPTRRLSLLAALAAARGLRDNDADPTGVFVFRREPRALADALLAGPPPEGFAAGEDRPVIYRLDLTAPGALFVAQDFQMRDGDAIFATNAPLTELRKFFQLFNTVLSPIEQTTGLAN